MKRSVNSGNYKRGRWQPRRGWNYRGVQNRSAIQNDSATEEEASQSRISGYFSDHPCPYKGWKLYFPNEGYSENNPKVQQVRSFEKFLKACDHLSKTEDIETRRSFMVDFKKLTTDEDLKEQMPELEKELISTPKKVIPGLGLAMHQLLWLQQQRELLAEQDNTSMATGQNDENGDLGEIVARVVNYDTQTPLCDLQASYYGKLVTIKGTVVRVSSIEPYCTQLAFQCTTCSEFQGFHLKDGKFKQPGKCISKECRGRTFTPQRKSLLTRTVDWQKIRIQEMNDARQDSGRVPRTVECELMCDLVDSCVPGDVITLTGIVKVNNSTDDAVHNKKDKCLFTLYIEANSICNSKGNVTGQAIATSASTTSSSKGSVHAGSTGIEFSLKDLYAVREIHEQKNLFYLLVHSLCPAIYGHEMVKAGLLLGLFGGEQKCANVKDRVPIRGDLHVLVVGDPGLGKSQMLQACAHVSPRGVYICGNTTTTAGLTVTVTKDGGLEAGALVLSDQGCCCIDEFDKMGTEQQALLEAMEQQCISIAKAGIVCSLAARTAVLAAANPVGGHYNKGKTVSENLKINAALLSRFDLVFILLDQPDEEMDRMLSKHVMAVHAGMPTSTTCLQQSRASTPVSVASELLPREPGDSLSERLKIKSGDNIDRIPHQLLSKYIGYAREYVHPKLSQPAVKVLQTFYLDLRKRQQNIDSTPVTTRQLESLIRLSEARARLELREEVTAEDATDVVEIMKCSMLDTYSDQLGILDFQRSQHGLGSSSRSLPKKFISVLTQLAERTNNSLFTMQQLRDVMKESNLNVQDFEGFIDSLNNHGFLLKKGPRLYQLQTVV